MATRPDPRRSQDLPGDQPEDLPDLTGRTVVVTGASAGIGAAAARRLHRLGATVVPVGRSATKTAAVAAELGVTPELVDLADLSSVRRLADRLLSRLDRIDVLLNNAGGTWTKRQVTTDGHEMTFQVNHLAPFLLTGLLRERLDESAARVVTTSSGGHWLGRVDLADLDTSGRYSSLRVYGTTKLENVLFTRELARQSLGTGLTATCFHPGFVATELSRDSGPLVSLGMQAVLRFARTPDQGADTAVFLAAAPADRWRSGAYLSDRHESRVTAQGLDDLLARQLWARSAELVGLDPERAAA